MKDILAYTTAIKGQKHDELMPLLAAMFSEFQELSKKKPDGALNKTKIAIVNRLLKDIFNILEGEPTLPYLDLLNEDNVPQNSDVALILSQVEAAMEAFKDRYYRYISGGRVWATKEIIQEAYPDAFEDKDL